MRRASSSDCIAKTVTRASIRADEGPHQPVALEGSVRDAAIGDHARHAARCERAQEVGPELRLHPDEEARPHRAEGAAHGARQIEREIAVGRHPAELVPPRCARRSA